MDRYRLFIMIICPKQYSFDIAKDPVTGRWLLDTTGLRWYHLDSLSEHISVKDCFAVNLFHISAFDLRIIENAKGERAFFIVKDASMGDGDLYQTDDVGFGYKRIVLYFIDYHPKEGRAKHYLFAEEMNGKWSVIELFTPGEGSFIGFNRIISGCLSEEAAIGELKKEKGVSVDDNTLFTRVDETFAPWWR